MTQNLLANGDFEASWDVEKSHAVLICAPGQPPQFGEVGNIFVLCPD